MRFDLGDGSKVDCLGEMVGSSDIPITHARRRNASQSIKRISLTMGAGWDENDDEDNEDTENRSEVQGNEKLAWLWVEGWRAQLRGGGDLIERCQFVEELD